MAEYLAVFVIFLTKNIGKFQILTFENLNKMLSNNVVSLEQLGSHSCGSYLLVFILQKEKLQHRHLIVQDRISRVTGSAQNLEKYSKLSHPPKYWYSTY